MNENHDNELLTPEEIAAIEPEEDESGMAALEEIAALADDDDEDNTEENETSQPDAQPNDASVENAEGAGETQPQALEAESVAPNATVDVADDIDAQYEQPIMPWDVVQEPPQNSADIFKHIKSELLQLEKMRDEGEIDGAEYLDKKLELEDQRAELTSVIKEYDRAIEQRNNYFSAQIKQAQSIVMKNAEADGIVYKNNPALQGELNTFASRLASLPGNENKSMQWLYQEADKRVRLLYYPNVNTASGKVATQQNQQPKQAAKQAVPMPRKSALRSLPPSLNDLPDAAGNDVASEFADIDQLTGLEKEDAIAALSPAALTRFLEGR